MRRRNEKVENLLPQDSIRKRDAPPSPPLKLLRPPTQLTFLSLSLSPTLPSDGRNKNRTISNSTYTRRLFLCSELAGLFPTPGERIRSGSAAAPAHPPLSAFFSVPPPPATAALCAASLASQLSASAVARFSRLRETVHERKSRLERAADAGGGFLPRGETQQQLGGGGAAAFPFGDASASGGGFAAASAVTSSSIATYEAVPILDKKGRAFCVIVEWQRSDTTKGIIWKARPFFFHFFFPF